jgi:hypothetical protein
MGVSFVRGAVCVAAISALVALSACSADPSPTGFPTASLTSPQPSATESPSPSATPTDSDFAGRDAAMADEEALARIANPKTGETWFSAPRPIAVPPWAAGDSSLGSSFVSWFEFGTRAGNTIVGYVDENIQELFERSPAGTWEWIGAPSARQPVTGASDVTFGFPEVPLNEAIYYDSLTLPAKFTLPTGEPLEVHEQDRGGLAIPGYTVTSQPSGTKVDTLGGYSIMRYATPVSFVWSGVYGVTAPPGVSYKDLYYMLQTPYGTYIPLFYDPFAGFDAVTWSVSTTVTSDPSWYLSDLNDISCGIWEKDHNTMVSGVASTEWVVGGKTTLGESVYVPKATNPLLQPLYDSYVASRATLGGTAASLEAFRTAPAFVGYVVPGSGQWIVYLVGGYSGRAWC